MFDDTTRPFLRHVLNAVNIERAECLQAALDMSSAAHFATSHYPRWSFKDLPDYRKHFLSLLFTEAIGMTEEAFGKTSNRESKERRSFTYPSSDESSVPLVECNVAVYTQHGSTGRSQADGDMKPGDIVNVRVGVKDLVGVVLRDGPQPVVLTTLQHGDQPQAQGGPVGQPTINLPSHRSVNLITTLRQVHAVCATVKAKKMNDLLTWPAHAVRGVTPPMDRSLSGQDLAVQMFKEVMSWFNSNRTRLEDDARKHRVLLIHGPPGTGKTTTVRLLLGELFNSQLVQAKEHPPSVLICAPSNAAVDVLMKSMLEGGIRFTRPNTSATSATSSSLLSEFSYADLIGESLQKRQSLLRQEDPKSGLITFVLRRALRAALRCPTTDASADEHAVAMNALPADSQRPKLQWPTMVRVQPRSRVVGQGVPDTEPDALSELNLDRITDTVQYAVDHHDDLETMTDSFRAELTTFTEHINQIDAKIGELPAETAASVRAGYFHGKKFVEMAIKKREEDVACCEVQQKIVAPWAQGATRQEIAAAVIDAADLVFSTLATTGSSKFEGARPFEIVIIDEAGQARESEALIPLGMKPEEPPKVVTLIGDHNQLAATVTTGRDDNFKTALSRSLFERLHHVVGEKPLNLKSHGLIPSNSVVDARPPVLQGVMLTAQFRMHPKISEFPSSRFYGGLLEDGLSVTGSGTHGKFPEWPWWHEGVLRKPLSFFDTSHLGSKCHQHPETKSYGNREEAKAVLQLLLELERKTGTDNDRTVTVWVLCPYRYQLGIIEDAANKCNVANDCSAKNVDLRFATVDEGQGGEADIVILSCVRDGGDPTGGVGFLKDRRRLNVALTRARFSMLVVGHGEYLQSHGGSDWKALVDHCKNTNCLFDLSRKFADTTNNLPQVGTEVVSIQ